MIWLGGIGRGAPFAALPRWSIAVRVRRPTFNDLTLVMPANAGIHVGKRGRRLAADHVGARVRGYDERGEAGSLGRD